MLKNALQQASFKGYVREDGAGGKLKTGMHLDGAGTPGCRLGYTLMKTMGLDIPSWGTQSNQTSKEIGEILV